jgi:hypothetical protein
VGPLNEIRNLKQTIGHIACDTKSVMKRRQMICKVQVVRFLGLREVNEEFWAILKMMPPIKSEH